MLVKGLPAAGGGPAGGDGGRDAGGGRRRGRLGVHLLLGLALAGTTWQTLAAPHTTGILLATFLPKFMSLLPDACLGGRGLLSCWRVAADRCSIHDGMLK